MKINLNIKFYLFLFDIFSSIDSVIKEEFLFILYLIKYKTIYDNLNLKKEFWLNLKKFSENLFYSH